MHFPLLLGVLAVLVGIASITQTELKRRRNRKRHRERMKRLRQKLS